MAEKIGSAVNRIIMLLFSLTVLFPLGWIIVKSLQTNREFFASAWGLPKVVQWGNYVKAWDSLHIGDSLMNTVVLVLFSLVFSLILTSAAAYVLTRMRFRGRQFLRGVIMFSLFLPGINALVPTYVVMRNLGMLNSIPALVVFNSLCGDAFALMVLGGFMQTIPRDFEESAFLDGASVFQTFRKIIIPMSMPGVVTLATFKALWFYNDFMLPYTVLQDQSKYTIGVNMYAANLLMRYKADWVALCAGVILAMIPPVVLFILFQRKVMEGATLGGLKG